jgi:hypothetical protein
MHCEMLVRFCSRRCYIVGNEEDVQIMQLRWLKLRHPCNLTAGVLSPSQGDGIRKVIGTVRFRRTAAVALWGNGRPVSWVLGHRQVEHPS